MLHQNATRESLGLFRIVVFGLWTLIVLCTPIHLFGDLPGEWFEPPGGAALLLPRPVYAALLDPAALVALKWLIVGLGIVVAAGTRFYTAFAVIFGVLLLLFDVLTKGFGGYLNHAQIELLFSAWLLAMFPQAADGLSLRRTRPDEKPAVHYAAPMVTVTLVFSLCYTFIGLRRLVDGGPGIFLGDALPAYLAVKSLDYGSIVRGFQYGLWIFESPWIEAIFKTGYFVTTVFEVLTPLCLFFRRLRLLWLMVIVPFHLATLLTMNIFFWENLILIALLFTPATHAFASWFRSHREMRWAQHTASVSPTRPASTRFA